MCYADSSEVCFPSLLNFRFLCAPFLGGEFLISFYAPSAILSLRLRFANSEDCKWLLISKSSDGKQKHEARAGTIIIFYLRLAKRNKKKAKWKLDEESERRTFYIIYLIHPWSAARSLGSGYPPSKALKMHGNGQSNDFAYQF